MNWNRIKALDIKEIILYLLILSLPFSNERGLATIEYLFTIYPAYLFGAAGVLFLLRDALRGKTRVLWRHPGAVFLWVFLLVIVVSIAQSRFIPRGTFVPMSSAISVFSRGTYSRSISQAVSILFMAAVFYFVLTVVRERAVFRRAVFLHILTVAAVAASMLVLYASFKAGYRDPVNIFAYAAGGSSPVYDFFERGARIQGFFTEPLTFGTYVVSGMSITLGACFVYAWRKYRRVFILAFLAQSIVMLLTLSRGAWIGSAVSLISFIAAEAVARRRVKPLLILACGAGLFILGLGAVFRTHPIVTKLRALTFDQVEVIANIRKYSVMSRENCDVFEDFRKRQKQSKSESYLDKGFRDMSLREMEIILGEGEALRQVPVLSRRGKGKHMESGSSFWLPPRLFVAEPAPKEVLIFPALPHAISPLAWSTGIRLNDIAAGIKMFMDHPVLGVGWGNYIYRYLDYDPRLMGWWWTDFPETGNRPGTPILPNLFVSVLAETGIAGFVAFIFFLYSLSAATLRYIRDSADPDSHLIALSCAAALAGILTAYQFFSTFYYVYVWVIIAFVVASSRENSVS